MHPNRMRWLDYWVGRPLCALLTLAARITNAGADRGRPRSPRNVVIIELAEMGSTVLAYPALARLRARHPESRLFFLVFPALADSVKVLDVVPDDHIFTIDPSSVWSLVRDSVRFALAARRERIDTAINLEMFARFSTMLGYLSGASTRVGFDPFTQKGLYCGDLFTHRVAYSPHIHTWQSFVALVDALDAPAGDCPMGKVTAAPESDRTLPRVVSDPGLRARLSALLEMALPGASGKRLIAINPNASKLIGIRKWPRERYAELTRRLLEDPDAVCVITGVASEREDADVIRALVQSDRALDLTGRTSLRELLELFTMADVLVTNDSGPAHFAALTDIPTVVFFGPETPALYGPISDRCTVLYAHYACSPCVSAYNQRLSPCTDNRCLTHFSVDQAYATVQTAMRPRAARH